MIYVYLCIYPPSVFQASPWSSQIMPNQLIQLGIKLASSFQASYIDFHSSALLFNCFNSDSTSPVPWIQVTEAAEFLAQGLAMPPWRHKIHLVRSVSGEKNPGHSSI
jgi:hypothetical protein